ncbi:MAG: tetraacyldisaccharide 4'-kinase [Gemmatimonadetes bacterium]|nr:tetraacyldisaccharide 4'-kinase [Gemmatimonadota bacterium]
MRAHAAARWLWSATTAPARLARASLVPAAAAYAACARVRVQAYRHGLLRSRRIGVPTIAVGNLSVGGTGKTPIASWIAAHCARRGLTPGIVLRGYGGDETGVHHERLPGAIVVQGRDRARAARRAVGLGARAIVLDDGFQRLDVRRDLNLLLVSAEASDTARRMLPAGPWREPWSAMRRADIVVVTRKRSGPEAARRLVRRIVSSGVPPTGVAVAHLALAGLTTLRTNRPVEPASLRGARVLAVSGVADPDSFAHQLICLGALVRSAPHPDHHRYAATDVGRLLSAAREVDYVVMTHKDAVKLRGLWFASRPTVLVAHLEPTWELGGDLVVSRINDLLTRHYTPGMY